MFGRFFKFVCVLLLAFTSYVSSANSFQPYKSYSLSDGLTHVGATSILEDSKGYVWVGTFDGLNRYNGYEFTNYKNTSDQQVLLSNRIRSLFEDSKGNIWIGTGAGICMFDYEQNDFVTIFTNENKIETKKGPVIRSFVEMPDYGIIAVSEGNGLLLFNYDYQLTNQYDSPDELNATDRKFLFFEAKELDNHNILLSYSHGVFQFNCHTGEYFKLFNHSPLYRGTILKLNDSLWLTNNNTNVSLFRVSKSGEQYEITLIKEALQGFKVSSASIDNIGRVWLATQRNGLLRFASWKSILSDRPVYEQYLPTNSQLTVNSILSTPHMGSWIATENQGILRFANHESAFRHLKAEGNIYGLKSNNVISLAEYDDSRVLIVTENGGLSCYNIQSQEFEELPFFVRANIKRMARSVHVDKLGHIWIQVGFNGLYLVRKGIRGAKFVLGNKSNRFLNVLIRTLDLDQYNQLWIGGLSGVHRIKLNESMDAQMVESLNNHSHFEETPITVARKIFVDPKSNYIWLAADAEGLIRMENDPNILLKEQNLEQFKKNKLETNSISGNFVTTIVRLSNNELWVGTEGGGICRVEDEKGQINFKSYSEKEGLSNHAVKAIQVDEEGNLWVSTNNGLNQFNYEKEYFRSFTVEEGLPFKAYNFSSARLKHGAVLFGGYGGLCIHYTSENIRREPLPILDFGELRVLNTIVNPGDTINNRVILNHAIQSEDRITLKHYEDLISIEIVSLHYSNPNNHFIKYKLEPISNDWVSLPSNQRYVNYSSLPPGKYKLRVSASNALDEWTEEKVLHIDIASPFWRTPLAIIIYIVILISIIYMVVKFRFRMIQLKHNLEIEHLEKTKQKDVDEAKLRYFANISHEIKTPITLISGPIEALTNKYNTQDDLGEQLGIIKRQSKKITQLINQVLDFQKSDAELLKMHYTQFKFNTFLQDLLTDFEFYAKSENKSLACKISSKEVYISADKDKLEKALNNILNNAFKYTQEKDTINVDCHQKGKQLIITITDTGRGIEKSDLPYVFNRFYQSRSQESPYIGGSGIGLAFTKRLVEMHYGEIKAESDMGKGTTITLTLPVIVNSTSMEVAHIEEQILKADHNDKATIKDIITPKDLKTDESLAKSHLFFVEDNTDMRSFVSKALSQFFVVTPFSNGKECLKALDHEWPDIIVSDVLMPEMNGFELCKSVKNNIKTSHLPIILLTACTSIDDKIHGAELGADKYLTKPFDIQLLVSSIEACLRSRIQLRERFRLNIPLTLEKGSNSDEVFLEKLYEELAKNLDNQELDVDQLASALYLNRTHFYQKVKAITNFTPFELLKEYRITKAADFLSDEKMSVNDAFAMTGFKSRTHFSKLFKEKFGVSPGKYKG